MIKFEIIKSSDLNRLGEYLFYKNQLFIGSNYSADLYFPSSKMEKDHAFAEIIDGKVLLHLGNNVDHIKVNGKRTTTFKYLKRGDTFTLINEQIKVLDFELEIEKNLKKTLNECSHSIRENKDLFDIINTFNNLRLDEK